MKSPTPKTTEANASPKVKRCRRKACSKIGEYLFRIHCINLGSLSLAFPLSTRLAKAGTVVKEKTNAHKTAMINVDAMGRNILPSTPESAKTGKKTITTIISPNPAAVRISTVAS